MSDDTTYEVIEGSTEGTEVGNPNGDPAADEPYDDDALDLETEPQENEVLPREDGEGTASPEDVERLTREQVAQVEEF
jgi:hypothetical protein